MSMKPSKRHRLKQKTSICLVQSDTPDICDYCGTIRHVNTQWVLLRDKPCCPHCREKAVGNCLAFSLSEWGEMIPKGTGENEMTIGRLQKAVEVTNIESKCEYKMSTSIGIKYLDPCSCCTVGGLLSSRVDEKLKRKNKLHKSQMLSIYKGATE